MKVSIIIPIYNVEEYIIRCLQSVTDMQTSDSEIECILVDDCGTDKSMQLATSYIAEYKGNIEFKILHHDKNRGLSAARNTGTYSATGDYLYYLDSDDSLTPKCLNILLDKVKKYPQVDMVQGYYDVSENIYKPLNASVRNVDDYISGNENIRKIYYGRKDYLPTTAWNKLVSKSLVVDNDIYFKEGLLYEDNHWVYFLSKKIKSIALVNQTTYIHYVTPNSIMSQKTNDKLSNNWAVILNDVLDNIDEPCCKMQLYKYLSVFATYYKNNDTYNQLLNKYNILLKQNGLYVMSFMLLMLKKTHSTFVRKCLYRMSYYSL